jgi:hypothetical protein
MKKPTYDRPGMVFYFGAWRSPASAARIRAARPEYSRRDYAKHRVQRVATAAEYAATIHGQVVHRLAEMRYRAKNRRVV